VKVLLDAHLSHQIAQLLVERGHDAQAVTSRTDLADNTPDAQLMQIAHAEGRAMVTNNIKDFRPIAAHRITSGQGHAGLILVSSTTRRTKAANRPLADAIEELMLTHPQGLADSERWI
jgi:predicted nuclease of predicted toxin-antitoxin system